MKRLLEIWAVSVLFLIAMIMMIPSCTNSSKSNQLIEKPAKAWYRIAAIGMDTVYSRAMNARGETGPIAFTENQQIRLELMAYTPIGNGMATYKLRVTNKQSCKGFARWNWEKINPTSIEPDDNTKGTPESDVLYGNQVKNFTMIAKATIGALLLKFEKYGNGDCSNSSTLRLNITLDILPVHFVACETYRGDASKNYDLFVNYTIETPEDANTFEIQKSDNGKDYYTIYSFASDKRTKVYSIRVPNTNS